MTTPWTHLNEKEKADFVAINQAWLRWWIDSVDKRLQALEKRILEKKPE